MEDLEDSQASTMRIEEMRDHLSGVRVSATDVLVYSDKRRTNYTAQQLPWTRARLGHSTRNGISPAAYDTLLGLVEDIDRHYLNASLLHAQSLFQC